jgi:hypothetical protein
LQSFRSPLSCRIDASGCARGSTFRLRRASHVFAEQFSNVHVQPQEIGVADTACRTRTDRLACPLIERSRVACNALASCRSTARPRSAKSANDRRRREHDDEKCRFTVRSPLECGDRPRRSINRAFESCCVVGLNRRVPSHALGE